MADKPQSSPETTPPQDDWIKATDINRPGGWYWTRLGNDDGSCPQVVFIALENDGDSAPDFRVLCVGEPCHTAKRLKQWAAGGWEFMAIHPRLVQSQSPLLAEYVDEGSWGNFALCGRCGDRCGRDSGCQTCDATGQVDGETCEDCLDGERWWCDRCGEIEGWLPKGQSAPVKSPAIGSGAPADGAGCDRAECQALAKDKARLDWWDAHPLKTQVHGGAEDGHNGKAWAVAAHSGNLRETLDALIFADDERTHH